MRPRELLVTPEELITLYAGQSAREGLRSVPTLGEIENLPDFMLRLYSRTMEQIMKNAARRQERPC